MKQIIYEEIGEPSTVLKIQEVPSPSLKHSDVRVAILATPIHPSNLLKISGQYGISPKLPEIPGTEGVGRVIEVGTDVQSLSVGQLVFLAGYSTWQQQVTGPAHSFIPLPEGGDIQQLSMLMINPITALRLLDSFVKLQQGEWVIQNAANSAVGCYLVQLAKAQGIRTINIVRRQSAVQPLLDLGADHVLIDGPDLSRQVRRVSDGDRIALGIDAIGGVAFSKMVDILSFRGTLVCYGLLSMQQPQLPSARLRFNELTIRGFWLAKWFEQVTSIEKQQTFAQVIDLVARGKLYAPVTQTFSLDDIQEAVLAASQSGKSGKVLLLPNS